ncbi:MAG: hypothetical protein F6K28_60740 [Microcoleus sp. SIO2G3]|nr:hypothetical protein [Microcoleus sp. SIO2G3]
MTAVNANDKTSVTSALYLCVISQLVSQRQSRSDRSTSIRPVPKTTIEPPLYFPKLMRVVSTIAPYPKGSDRHASRG